MLCNVIRVFDHLWFTGFAWDGRASGSLSHLRGACRPSSQSSYVCEHVYTSEHGGKLQKTASTKCCSQGRSVQNGYLSDPVIYKMTRQNKGTTKRTWKTNAINCQARARHICSKAAGAWFNTSVNVTFSAPSNFIRQTPWELNKAIDPYAAVSSRSSSSKKCLQA